MNRYSAIAELALEAQRVLAEADPVLGKVMADVGPCHWPDYVMEPFDALVWSILGQQISVQAAASITNKLGTRAGRPFDAAALADLPEVQFREAGLSRNKTRTVRELSTAILDGAVDMDTLADKPDAEVSAMLCALRGIGPWTAEMFLIFGLGRPDVFSGGDLGLRKAIAIAWQLDTVPDSRECTERARSWAPYRTVAAWYLWRLVDPR